MTVKQLCESAGLSRQAYYEQRKTREREAVDEQLVLDLVRRVRQIQPQMGTRKLHVEIAPELAKAGVRLGRDRLFEILRKHDLLIKRKRRTVQTTDSRHGLRVYENQAQDLALTGPHQLWVSDITYVRTDRGFVYLALIMDAFSRAIVGYDCSDSLEALGALRALQMARGQLPAGARPMHHSDRGIQYCCGDYIAALTEGGLAISMTEANHCYENAKAERLNGTLKNELGLSTTFTDVREAKQAADQAVMIYNHLRPHQALGYRKPMPVHRAGEGAGEQVAA